MFIEAFESIGHAVADAVIPDGDSSKKETDHYGKTLEDYTREAEEKESNSSSSSGWFW